MVNKSFAFTTNRLSKKLEELSPEEQEKILAVVDTMIKNANK